MNPSRDVASESTTVDNGGEPSAAALFAIVWVALADLLGTAAVAAIVRRAVRSAAAEHAELTELVVTREDFEYRYALPAHWSQKTERARASLRALLAEVARLLVELTGTVAVRRLEQIPELRAAGLLSWAGDN